MKLINIFPLLLLFVSVASGKEKSYTGSTPANAVVRLFLDISPKDSIDFIRWQLMLNDSQYKLNCNYGIGKPNTNGFINSGKQIELTGVLTKEKDYYQLHNANKNLKLFELNTNLLHFADEKNNLLIGNGGWSYTLNNITPLATDKINIHARQTFLNDSIVFQGRTPCRVPGIIPQGKLCYKIKWLIVLYANDKNEPGTYKINGTRWPNQGGKKGNWKIVNGKDRIVYRLNDDNGNAFLYLLKLDENILVFTDAAGRLLIGDEDFSYTLNRVRR